MFTVKDKLRCSKCGFEIDGSSPENINLRDAMIDHFNQPANTTCTDFRFVFKKEETVENDPEPMIGSGT